MKRSHKRRLTVECLETRWLMAGDVSAYVAPDSLGREVLVIEGDHQSNEIRIVEQAAGHVRVEGLNCTTVNGKAADEVFASGDAFFAVEVSLGNGNDSVIYELDGHESAHPKRIQSGTGDDAVTVVAAGVVRGMSIDTAQGNDDVTLEMVAGSWILGLSINTGVGNDDVIVRADSGGVLPSLSGLGVIDTAQGDDVVQFEGSFIVLQRSLPVLLGEGNDTLIGDSESASPLGSGVDVNGGRGDDVALNSSYFGTHRLSLFETIVP